MKYLVAILCCAVLAQSMPSYIHPYPIHPGVGSISKGPSSETIIKGPDGSVITSAAEGGVVAAEAESPGVVLTGGHAPIVEPLPVIAPVVSPVVAPIVPVAAPVVLRENPIIVEDQKIVQEHVLVGNRVISVPKKVEDNTDLVGPSGTISTRGGDAVISGPSSITVKGDGVVASIDKQPDVHVKTLQVKPVVAPVVATPIVAPVVAPAPVIETHPIVNDLRRPLYAPDAPVINSGIIRPVGQPFPGPIYTESSLTHADLTLLANGPANFVPHYAPAHYGPILKPIYRGHF